MATGISQLGDLLIQRGAEGVSLRELTAERDPSTRERILDYSLFDSDEDQSDRVIDRGARGIDDAVALGAASALISPLRGGAVLDIDNGIWQARWGNASPDVLDARVRLVGWSGLGRVHRQLPTPDELAITDPVERLAAFLLAGGCRGQWRTQIAYWTAGLPADEDLYMLDRWGAATQALQARGWEIRGYVEGGDSRIQTVATPDHPMRPPTEPPGDLERDDYRWPAHSYLFVARLWAAIVAVERSRQPHQPSYTGGTYGLLNPRQHFGRPLWFGEPVPDGEVERGHLREWADANGHEEVVRLAVPGSVELLLHDDPVGVVEIAARLHVQRQTVDQWAQRGILPERDFTVGGRPAWRWGTVERWAQLTKRLSPRP